MKKVLLGSMLASLLAFSSITVQAAAPTSIAVINIAQIMSEIPQAKQSRQKLESEFNARQNELKKLSDQLNATVEKLKKNGSFMKEKELTETQRKAQELQAQLQIKEQAFQEDYRKRMTEEEKKLIDKIKVAVDKIAKEKGYDLVLNGIGVVVFEKDSVDISKEVISLVSKSN